MGRGLSRKMAGWDSDTDGEAAATDTDGERATLTDGEDAHNSDDDDAAWWGRRLPEEGLEVLQDLLRATGLTGIANATIFAPTNEVWLMTPPQITPRSQTHKQTLLEDSVHGMGTGAWLCVECRNEAVLLGHHLLRCCMPAAAFSPNTTPWS